MCGDIRIGRFFTRRIWRTVVCRGLGWRWVLGAGAGLVGVSGCRAQVIAVRSVMRCGGGSGGVGVAGVAVGVGQTALDSELHQLVIAQVAVEGIILEGQTGSCRSRARDAGCCHDEAVRSESREEQVFNQIKQLQIFTPAD